MKANGPDDWSFAGYSRFEGLIVGGLKRGGPAFAYRWETDDRLLKAGRDIDVPPHLADDFKRLQGIAGGSDAGVVPSTTSC